MGYKTVSMIAALVITYASATVVVSTNSEAYSQGEEFSAILVAVEEVPPTTLILLFTITLQ